MSVKLDSYVAEGVFLLPSYIFVFIMLAGLPTATMWTTFIVFLLCQVLFIMSILFVI